MGLPCHLGAHTDAAQPRGAWPETSSVQSSRCVEEEGSLEFLPGLRDRRALTPDSPPLGAGLSLTSPSLSGKGDAKLEEHGGEGHSEDREGLGSGHHVWGAHSQAEMPAEV